MIRFQSLLILLQVGCLLDSVLSLDPVHECKIRVKGYTGGDSDKSGFIEVDNIVVKRFSETSSDPNKNGFHVVTIDWLCQAVDIQSFPLDAKSPFNIIDPDGLMDYFMNTNYGQVMIVATGQKVDTAIKGLLKQVLTTVGVQISSSITQNDALVFVARRGYPHETIQRVIPDALGPQPALAVVVTQWKWYTNQFSSDCFPSLPTPGQLTAYTSKDLHHFPKLAFRCNGYIIGWEYVLGEKPEDIIVSVWNIYNNQLGTHYLHLADLDPFQYGRYFINHEYFDSYVTFGQTRMYTANGYSIGFHYPSASSAGQALLLWGDSRQTYWDQSHLGQSYFDAVRSGRTYSNKYSAPVSFRGTTQDGYVRGLPSLRPIMSTSPYVARVRDLTSDPAGSQRILSLNYYATQNVGSIDAETLYIFQTSLKFDGYVIGIEYYRAGAGEFYFATYNSKFELIMNSATTISVAKPGETYVRIPESQKLDVRPGDFLAIGFPTGMTSPLPIAAAKDAAATRAVWTVAVSGLNAHSALPATIVGKTAATISQLAFRLFYYARTALDDGQFPKVVPQNPFEIANCYVDSNCYSRDTNLRCILRKCKCRYGMTYDYFHQTCIWDGNFAYVGWTYYLGSLTENPSSSTRWKLIDGITESGFNTIFADTSCYFLPNLMKPWVVVRLGGEVDVSVVEITPFDIREFDSYIEIYDKTFSGIQYVIRADEITNPSKYLSMASFLPKQIDSVKVHGPEAWWLVDTDTDSCTSFSESTWITLTRGSYNSEQLGAVGANKTDCIRKIDTFYIKYGSRCLTVNENNELTLIYRCNKRFYFADENLYMLETDTLNVADRCVFAPDLKPGTTIRLSACTTQIKYSGGNLRLTSSGKCLTASGSGSVRIADRICGRFRLYRYYPDNYKTTQGATTSELSIDINKRCTTDATVTFKSSFPRVPNFETKIAGQDPVDFEVYVSDVLNNKAQLKVCRNSFDSSTAVKVKVAWKATLEHLHDFRIGVGNTSKSVMVESQYKTCATVSGPVRSGITHQINCTQIHRGKYLAIHFIGNKDLSTRETLSLCEVKVRGNPVVIHEAPCSNDSICTMVDPFATPVGDENMVCVNKKCVCAKDFLYNSSLVRCVYKYTCSTRNNCTTYSGKLKPHAHCHNHEDRYKCGCDDGFEWDESTNECTNVDECLDNNGECEDGCIDSNPDLAYGLKYTCDCKNKIGHELAADKRACADINECVIGPPTYRCGRSGPINSDCRNLPGSYECYCDHGWAWNDATFVCDNIDECALHNGGCEDECVDQTPGYNCTCANMGPGYEVSGHYCKDIDECVSGTGECQNGAPAKALCINTPGSYKCICEEGWVWNISAIVCDVESECDTDNGGCSHICKRTTPGEYECSCHAGYELESNHHTCADKNECSNVKACPRNSKCINNIGSYWCKCDIGWRWNSTTEVCDNVDECEDRNGGCGHECEDRSPGYRCSCRSGFELDDDDYSCNDIDECDVANLCEKVRHAECQNDIGSFHCICHKGWKWNPKDKTCDVFSACQQKNGGCNHICTDLPEDYLCSCKDGYMLGKDNHTCFDIDECASANACKSVKHAHCYNSLGSFRCICDKGSKWNGKTCQDINECAVKNGGCQDECVNNEPGYHCTCNNMGLGYELKLPNGHVCEDVDECEEKTGDCQTGHPVHAVCTNTPGSYRCTCQKGWTWNDRHKICDNIDECLENNGGCSHTCHDRSPGYVCKCTPGYDLQKDLRSCADANECEKRNSCVKPASCVNDVGSYHCVCPLGFEWNATSEKCEDVNECATVNGNCWHHCLNTLGSRICSCKEGWRLLEDRQSCDDEDECEDDNGDCQHLCINTAGNYRCECKKGYIHLERDRKKCRDLNECTEIGIHNGGCAHKCINKQPGFRCECKKGYRLEANNKTCVDIDECREGTHGCDYDCDNQAGSYVCVCAPDKTFNPATKTCIELFALEFTVFTTNDYLPVFAYMNDMHTVVLKEAIQDAIEKKMAHALFDYKYRQSAISSFKASGKGKMGVVWKSYFDKELSLKEISHIFPLLWTELVQIEFHPHKDRKHTVVSHPHPRVEFNKPDGEHLAIVMDDPTDVCGPYNYLHHCEDNEICRVEHGYPICKCKGDNCEEEHLPKKSEGFSTLELTLIISFSAVAFLLLLTLCACFMWRTKPWSEASEHHEVPISKQPRYYATKPMHPSMQPWNTNFRPGYSAGFPRHVF